MIRLVMLVSLVTCAILQAILPAWERMGQAKAPLLLGGLLYYALTRERGRVAEAAIYAGLLQDALGPIPLGFSALAFCVIGLIVNQFRERIFGDHWVTHLFLGALASAAMTLMLYVLLLSSGLRMTPLPVVLLKTLGVTLSSLVAVPLVFKSIEWLDVKLGNVQLQEI